MKYQISAIAALVAALTTNAYAVEKSTNTNAKQSSLESLRVVDESMQGIATSCIVMNDAIDDKSDPGFLKSFVLLKNLKSNKFVDVSPFVQDKKICLSGLSFGTPYEVTLRKGLKSVNNKSITKDIVEKFTTIDSKPSIGFVDGLVLSSDSINSKQNSISISSTNFNSFKLSLFKISTKDLPASQLYTKLDSIEKWQLTDLIQDHGKFIKSKIYKVNSTNQSNDKVITNVDLKDFSDPITNGIYVFLITQNDDNTGTTVNKLAPEWESLAVSKLLFISDFGVSSYSGEQGIDVAVRSIQSAKPTKDALVQLVSVGNEVLASQRSDENGYVHFNKELCEGDNASAPALIVVSDSKNDFFALDLRSTNLFLEDAVATNEYSSSNIASSDQLNANQLKVFAFTNRSILRPGEKVYYQAYVRKPDLTAAQVKALKLTIYKPDYSIFKEVTLTNPVSGSFEYEFTLPESAQLGTYKFDLGLDKDSVISSNDVTVAAFKPSAIKTDVQTSTKDTFINDSSSITLNTEFNYGAPAKNLNVNGFSVISPNNHPVEKYSDFYFGVNEKSISDLTSTNTLDSGVTDKEGKFTFSPSINQTSFPQKYEFNLSVLAPSSNVSSISKTYNVAFDKLMIGVKKLDTDVTSDESKLQVILSDQKGNLNKGNLNYVIQKINVSYQYAYVDSNWKFIRNEYLSPVSSGQLKLDSKLNKDTNTISSKLDDGMYVITLKSDATDCQTSFNFYSGTTSSLDATSPDRFVLSTDKEIYRTGDTVKLSFDSEFDGYADLVLGKNGVIAMKHYEINRGHNVIDIKSDQSMNTGTYALISTYSSMDNKFKTAARSIGLTYIKMDTTDKQLKVSTTAPKEIKPNSQLSFDVNVSNSDDSAVSNNLKTYVSVSLTDNGILSINNQKAPNPYLALTARDPLQTKLHDMYNYIIKDVKGTGQGYGDNEMLSAANIQALSNITENLFSKYTKRIEVVNGKAHVDFDIPSISTSAKIMVTAFNEKQLGSSNQDVYVKDSTVSKIIAPYYLRTGDSLNAILNINNLAIDDTNANYSYTVDCSGSIKCSLSGKSTVAKSNDKNIIFNISTLNEGVGKIKYTVHTDSKDYTFENEKNIVVLSNSFPILETKIAALAPNSSSNIVFKQNFVDKTQVEIKKSSLPLISTSKIIQSFDETNDFSFFDATSKGLAYVNALEQISDTNSKEYKDLSYKINKSVEYVQSFINQQGYIDFGLVSYDEGRFASAYAASFMFKADALGFDVSDNSLAYLEKALLRNITDDNEQTAALSMYVLAKANSNVKTNLTYRFDHNDIKSVKALADYAHAFNLYGDKRRELEAINRGIQALNELATLRHQVFSTKDVNVATNLMNQIKEYQPFYVNTYTHDVLSLLSACVEYKDDSLSDEITTLCDKLVALDANYTNYIDSASKAIFVDLNRLNNGSKETSTKSVLANRTVSVKNDDSTKQFVSATAYGKVTGNVINPSDLSVTKRFFTMNGKEIKAPLNVNVNDDVIVLLTVNTQSHSPAVLHLNEMLPSNMMYLRSINSDEAEATFKFLGKLTPSYDIKQNVGDTNMFAIVNARSSTVTMAYILKAAYTGQSNPCMTHAKSNEVSVKSYFYLNPTQSITVK